jgi:hypothetical protein
MVVELRNELSRGEVLATDYEYDSRERAQRKVVTTTAALFVYHQRGGLWVFTRSVPLTANTRLSTPERPALLVHEAA